jgi:hypothetical protein
MDHRPWTSRDAKTRPRRSRRLLDAPALPRSATVALPCRAPLLRRSRLARRGAPAPRQRRADAPSRRAAAAGAGLRARCDLRHCAGAHDQCDPRARQSRLVGSAARSCGTTRARPRTSPAYCDCGTCCSVLTTCRGTVCRSNSEPRALSRLASAARCCPFRRGGCARVLSANFGFTARN